ncbi:cadherin-like domain-containing protein [Polaribacter vadi]|mgnify:CR=1 FL=1|uniref:cadherin-like domain-containing protein n=1 Tax=Polaribacter vadi TaxID=1774273 RepID=UPI0030EF5F28
MIKKSPILCVFLLLFFAQFLVAQVTPVANNDVKTTLINTSLTENTPGLLINDTDADGDSLTITEFLINGTTFTAGENANFSEGSIVISADGSFNFDPNLDFLGTVSEINYTVSDGTFTSNANLNITVTLPPEPPVANNDEKITFINTPITENAPGLLINDTDANGDVLTITEFLINGTTFTAGENASFSEGSILILADGSYSFTPRPNFLGTVSDITYTVTDGTFTSTATLNITVKLPPEPPVARTDYDTVDINTTLNVPAPGVFINDTDANEEDDLNVTQFSVNGMNYTAGTTASLSEGTITIAADGSYIFIPTTDYTGIVLTINYTISDGTFTSSANLLLTVEFTEDLLEINNLGSCNQGFNSNGEYKIVYSVQLTNRNNSRDRHEAALIRNIDLINNLQDTFGVGCLVNVDQVSIRNDAVQNIAENTFFPREFTVDAFNPAFTNGNSSSFFNASAISDLILYPRQSIFISFCVTVNAFCDGRSNPTPAGSGIDFTNTMTANTDKGNNATDSITLTDFHTTEAVVSAGLYVPEFNNQSLTPPGVVNSDGTFDYINTVIITNEGTSAAQNINFNMGLEGFLRRVSFNDIIITQVSGPAVTVNPDFNGDDNTTLLLPNNSLPAGETITLEVFYLIGPIDSSSYSYFEQTSLSQTQGDADGFDATSAANKTRYSFVTWSDGLGDHLDRYYFANSATAPISSALYCSCTVAGMRFIFDASSKTDKSISSVNETPNGILEHEEVTFQITIENTSESVQLTQLQLQDNLNNACNGKVLSVSTPIISSSTATTNPTLNAAYNGTSNINLFDGSSGLLKINETITVEFTVLFNETCFNTNTAVFSARDPLGRNVPSSNSVNVNISTDTDNDGITNDIDIDDDNDTIPDIAEYNGLNPLDDDDADFIPNYRDTDFGADTNADGIIDIFDFDLDGVPNHLDLDSDNDGILDIVEAGNATDDTNTNGATNNVVGANGLDNTKENGDTIFTTINYIIPNTDANGNANFIDIDADGDGIVDNIEAQPTNNYITLNTTFSLTGINSAYPSGLNPVDTENDGIPDYIDINSDNDIRDDIIEGWDANSDGTPETLPLNSDADNDGLDDAFDVNDTQINPTNGQTPLSFPNFDDEETPERDWREIIAIFVLIDNISQTEGTDFMFTIQLVTKNDHAILVESASPIDFTFSTLDGTTLTDVYDVAIAPFDYISVSNTTFTIAPFTTTAQVVITSLEDPIFEFTELFTLNGTITSDNTLNENITGIGSILDNDAAPSITMNNSRELEGVDLLHTITISNPASTPISVEIVTRDRTAISPEDYNRVFDNFTIEGTTDPNNANTEVSFTITSLLDNLNELDEEEISVVGVGLTNNLGNQDLAKTATIIDIDPNPIVEIDNTEAEEGNDLEFTISLLNDNDELMQNYIPININIETIDDTTTANLDYQSLSTQIAIPAFTSTIKQSVKTINDKLNEKQETLFLQLNLDFTTVSNTSSPLGIGTIIDNDYPNLFSPNNDGVSDVFKLSGLEEYPNFVLIIFNRQGNEVYKYSNNGNLNPVWWDGTYNDKPAPTGVYFYTLDFNDGVKKPIKNFIQLIR